MRFFQNFSIKSKLIGIILLVSILAIGTGFTLVIINNIKTFKEDMVNNTFVNAGLFGEYCITPMAFEDKKGAAEILQKLEAIPSIMNGYVYDESGDLFAAYNKSGNTIIPPRLNGKPAAEFEGKYLHVVQPVIYQDQKYGTIYLRASTAILDNKIKNHLITMMLLLAGLTLISYFLAHRFQKVISGPILKLANVTKEVSEKADFSVRVEKKGDDEIGALYDGFNEMMEQIQMRKHERDKAELALRESEEKFRKVFESSYDAMILLDENEFLDCNNATLRIFGYATREEFLGKHPSEVSPPKQTDGKDSRLTADERIAKALREGSCFFEWTHRRSNGEVFPAEVLLTTMEIEGRKVIQATVRDITERKKVEEELRKHREHLEELVKERTGELEEKTIALENEITIRTAIERNLRTEKAYIDQLFESAQEAIVVTGKDGRVLRLNSEFIRLFGYTIDEAIGAFLDDLIASKEYYDEAVSVTKKVAEGEKIVFESVRRRKDGTLLNVSLLASPIIVDGKLIAIYGIYRDITKLKKAEKALKERSKELAEANIRLKELDRLKSMFIASMSHELRTPLNSIIGFTGLILQGLAGEINAEQKDQLQRVYGSAKHLLALISDVIDISKIEAGKVEVYTEEFQLEGVIEEAVSSIKTQIDDKRLDLEIIIPQGLRLKTDRKRLLQCVLNYLSNAVKFTEKGNIRIAAEEIDGTVKITVKDSGIGIKKEDMTKLFNSFVRLDSPLRFTTLGTGLGLYLTKKLATEMLKGLVSVESSYGKGSTFMLEVPKEIRDEK